MSNKLKTANAIISRDYFRKRLIEKDKKSKITIMVPPEENTSFTNKVCPTCGKLKEISTKYYCNEHDPTKIPDKWYPIMY
jgi:hypothetical protein